MKKSIDERLREFEKAYPKLNVFYFLCLVVFLLWALCVLANAHEGQGIAIYQIAGGTAVVSITDYVNLRNEYSKILEERDIITREFSALSAENGRLRAMIRIIFSATTIDRLRDLIRLLGG